MTHGTPRETPAERRRRYAQNITQFLIASLLTLILFALLYSPSIITGTG